MRGGHWEGGPRDGFAMWCAADKCPGPFRALPTAKTIQSQAGQARQARQCSGQVLSGGDGDGGWKRGSFPRHWNERPAFTREQQQVHPHSVKYTKVEPPVRGT